MFTASLLLALAAAQPPRPIIPLWEGKAPHAVGDTDTDKPSITVFRAPADKANGAAVIVVPGGGYQILADDHEGKQVAEFLNGIGVTAFVLKYRIVTKDRSGPLHPAPLEDAQRAIRFARSKAKDYGIDPARIGIWGFSAGGHLASTAGTHFDAGKADGDAIDKVSGRPDFLILCYPVISMDPAIVHKGSREKLMGPNPDEKLIDFYSTEKQVTKDTPPTFIFHTTTDAGVPAEHSVKFYLACKKAGVPVEMHIYERGKHGVGLGRDPKWTGGEKSVATWPNLLVDWLNTRALLEKK